MNIFNIVRKKLVKKIYIIGGKVKMDRDKFMKAYYLYKKDIAEKCGINYDRLNENELRILMEQMKKEERNDEYIAGAILRGKSDEFVSIREIDRKSVV